MQLINFAWLILENYPAVNCVQVRIWNTRINDLTYLVEFRRENLHQYANRVRMAAFQWWKYRDTPIENVPVWPEVKKCADCNAAALCKHAGRAIDEFNADPGGYVDAMVALQARIDAMQVIAAAHVDKTGDDIVSPRGNCFGVGKPKTTRKPSKAIYQQRKEEDDDAE